MTVGVLPVPPALMFPTQMTGTSALKPVRFKRRFVAAAYSEPSGASIRACQVGRSGGVLQKRGGRTRLAVQAIDAFEQNLCNAACGFRTARRDIPTAMHQEGCDIRGQQTFDLWPQFVLVADGNAGIRL